MEALFVIVEIVRRLCQRLGPYLFVEIVLPGGTLLALLLFLYRRRRVMPVAAARDVQRR
jgi:hypothetical protein